MNCAFLYCDRRVQPNSFLCDKHARKEPREASEAFETDDWYPPGYGDDVADLFDRGDAGFFDEPMEVA